MTEEKANKFHVNDLSLAVENALFDAGPDDYIITSGPLVVLSILTARFALRFGRLNLLIWARGRNPEDEPRYLLRRINLA